MLTREEARGQFEREERAYWDQREQLLAQYRGKWVAIVDGQVVAVGNQMNKAAAEALRKTGSGIMFVTLVGEEDFEFRIRQIKTGHFDTHYRYPMPILTAPVSDVEETAQADVDFIVDTGADITVLRVSVADALGLRHFPGGWARIRGLAGPSERRQLFNALVRIAGQLVLISADCRDDINEDLLGRDVTNEFALTLCAKRAQVQFEWVEEKPA